MPFDNKSYFGASDMIPVILGKNYTKKQSSPAGQGFPSTYEQRLATEYLSRSGENNHIYQK